jgi:Domain of Unknown Function (DUF928)
MQNLRLFYRPRPLAQILMAIGLGVVGYAQPGEAQPVQHANQPAPAQIIFNNPPPDLGTPDGRRRGGANRGPCQSYEGLTALVPTTDAKVWGLTVSAYPTFWFYLPHQLTDETAVEFTVQDASDNSLYNTRFTAPNTASGLIKLTIPSAESPLEVNQSYSWTLAIFCDPARPFASVSVSGTIRRVAFESDDQTQLNAASPLEQVNLYAARGIWFDALDTLATLYWADSQPSQLTTTWADLLQQANLEHVAEYPRTECCIP